MRRGNGGGEVGGISGGCLGGAQESVSDSTIHGWYLWKRRCFLSLTTNCSAATPGHGGDEVFTALRS